MIHTGGKHFQCKIYGKTLLMKCNLLKYKLSHTYEKPYQCGICEEGFLLSGHLKET
uniref:C2H2-type domain-containing protein n=1 Tax=Octopus bimaculoides TaxID=37653 RepID=A0A0L8G0E3_OCTBM